MRLDLRAVHRPVAATTCLVSVFDIPLGQKTGYSIGVTTQTNVVSTWTYFSQESITREGNLVSSINYRRKGGTERKKDPGQRMRRYMSIQRFRGDSEFRNYHVTE